MNSSIHFLALHSAIYKVSDHSSHQYAFSPVCIHLSKLHNIDLQHFILPMTGLCDSN